MNKDIPLNMVIVEAWTNGRFTPCFLSPLTLLIKLKKFSMPTRIFNKQFCVWTHQLESKIKSEFRVFYQCSKKARKTHAMQNECRCDVKCGKMHVSSHDIFFRKFKKQITVWFPATTRRSIKTCQRNLHVMRKKSQGFDDTPLQHLSRNWLSTHKVWVYGVARSSFAE